VFILVIFHLSIYVNDWAVHSLKDCRLQTQWSKFVQFNRVMQYIYSSWSSRGQSCFYKQRTNSNLLPQEKPHSIWT